MTHELIQLMVFFLYGFGIVALFGIVKMFIPKKEKTV